MDHRFPKWLRITISKLDFLSLPNLGMLIAGLAVLGFLGNTVLQAPMERFVFDPVLFLDGEWWRLFAFPTLSDPIFLLFFVMYSYFVMNTLEEQWGPTPTTVFTLLSYLAALGASMLAGRPLSIWTQVMENVSLAFGTLFPNIEFYLFFILPVKAKWLAMFAGALFLLQFIRGTNADRIFLAVALSPYLLFFGTYLGKECVAAYKLWQHRRRHRP